MLLEFKAQNYKSFKDEFTFSLIPDNDIKELSYSILEKKIGEDTYKGLSSAVIYGANASGKSNIISAIHTFQQIILRGNIENAKYQDPDIAAYQLEMIPNCSLFDPNPIFFSITFITGKLHISYELQIDLGTFSQEKTAVRKILFERLIINNNDIFIRTDTIKIKNLNTLTEFFDKKFNKVKDQASFLAKNNLSDQHLFLTNGFKNIYSNKLTEIILEWIGNKLIVLYQVDKIKLGIASDDMQVNEITVDKITSEIGKIIGTNSKNLGVIKDNETGTNLCSLIDISPKRQVAIPYDVFESYGTVRFLNLFPSIIKALILGGTLIIDEFDASLHPRVLMNIINIFHHEEINKNGAQLIFNTHNPIFLNTNLFRQDEIKFVEKDNNGFSSHYSLSDFNITPPRTPDEYMKNYFIDKYGAIEQIDFSNLFIQLINGNTGNN